MLRHFCLVWSWNMMIINYMKEKRCFSKLIVISCFKKQKIWHQLVCACVCWPYTCECVCTCATARECVRVSARALANASACACVCTFKYSDYFKSRLHVCFGKFVCHLFGNLCLILVLTVVKTKTKTKQKQNKNKQKQSNLHIIGL